MGNIRLQLVQNCPDRPGIAITGVRITDGPQYLPPTSGPLDTAIQGTRSLTAA